MNNIKDAVERYMMTDIAHSSGACYFSGHILIEHFKQLGYKTRKVTGELFLMDKRGRYLVYGNQFRIKKSTLIGYYHTWCEVDIDGATWIVDPSIKANKNYLKREMKIKVSSKVPDVIITDQHNTYNWKYIENPKLNKKSDAFLNMAGDDLIKKMLDHLKGKNIAA